MPDRKAHAHSSAQIAAVDTIIQQRHTAKRLRNADTARPVEQDMSAGQAAILEHMLSVAGWAPFHKKADQVVHRQGPQDSVVPWRFHILGGRACATLLEYLRQQAVDQPDSYWARAWQSKVKEMLSACGALVQVTWLPDPPASGTGPDMSRNNVEHIAATAAATQNLLLACEARGWSSYWSSGGILRDEAVFGQLGIDSRQELLGSVFVSPPELPCDRVIEGGLREQRGQPGSYLRWV